MEYKWSIWVIWVFTLASKYPIWAENDPFPKSGMFDDDLPPECQRQSTRYDSLACWLFGLRLSLPDQSFQSGFLKVDISGLQCSQFEIAGLESQIVNATRSPHDKRHKSIQLAVANVSASCAASYYSTGLGGHIHAQLGPSSDSNAVLHWTLSIADMNQTGSVQRPGSVQTLRCETGLGMLSLQFTGSTSARIIDLFRERIGRYITDELNEQLCPILVASVDPLLSKYIRRINDYLEPYLQGDHTKLDKDAIPDSSAVSRWRHLRDAKKGRTGVSLQSQAPFLVQTLTALNTYVSYYLQRGLLQHWFPNTYWRDLDCGWIFSGINGFVNILMRSSNGELHIKVPQQRGKIPAIDIPGYARLDMQVIGVTLSGLDDWSRLVLLRPNDDGFLSSLATTSQFDIALDIVANVSSINGTFQGDNLVENFRIHVNTSSMEANLIMAVDVALPVWDSISSGEAFASLANSKQHNVTPLPPCMLRMIDSMQVVDMEAQLRLSGMSLVPSVTGNRKILGGALEHDVDRVLNNILAILVRGYPMYISRAIYGLSKGPAMKQLNEFMNDLLEFDDTRCFDPNKDLPSHFANFSKFEPLKLLNNVLREPRTLKQLNGFLNCTSKFLSRALLDWMNAGTDSGVNDGAFRMKGKDFAIQHAGSVNDLALLNPTGDGLRLNSTFDYGTSWQAPDQPMMQASVEVDLVPLNLSLSIDGNFGFSGMGGAIAADAKYNISELHRMRAADLLGSGFCLALPLIDISIVEMHGHLGAIAIDLNATASWGANHSSSISFDTNEYPIIAILADSAARWIGSGMRDLLWTALKQVRGIAKITCPAASFEQDDPVDNNINVSGILMTILAFVVLAQPVLFLIPRNEPRRRLEPANGPSSTSDDETSYHLLLDEAPDAVTEGLEREPDERKALADSDVVPPVARFVIPVFILLTMILLLSSNLGVGATVDLHAVLGSRRLAVPAIFSFSLLNTAGDMLEAGIIPLFLLIAVFSGIWPYTKLLIMMYAWVASPSSLPSGRRGRLLLALDALSKFSLVDAYVLIFFMVAFRFQVSLSGDASLDVSVRPQFGFYGFLLAIQMSLVIGHILVLYHRREELNSIAMNTDKQFADSLIQHGFRVDDKCRRLSSPFVSLLLAAFIISFALLAIGSILPSFSFEVGGLAGFVIGDARKSVYSLVSLGLSLRTAAPDTNKWAILLLQAVYFFYTLVAPFVSLCLLLFMTLVPMKLKAQLVVLNLVEIANACSAIEVFALSVVAAVMQISRFAAFMVGDRCLLLDELLVDYMGGEISTCYTVDAFVSWSSMFLLVGVVLNSILVSLVLRLVHVAVRENLQKGGIQSCRDSLAPDQDHVSIVQWMAEKWRWTLVEVDDSGDPSSSTNDDGESLLECE